MYNVVSSVIVSSASSVTPLAYSETKWQKKVQQHSADF